MANANIKKKNKQKLLNLFNISTKKTKKYPSGIAPGKVPNDKNVSTKNNGEYSLKPIDLPSDLQRVYSHFEKDFTVSNKNNTPEKRQTRDKELEFMIYNEGLMYASTQIYTNETTQADSQDRVVGIKGAKKGTESYFYKWLNDIGLSNSVLNSLAWDLTSYGNGFYIKSIDLGGGGITGVVPIDQSECMDVIEFQGVRVKKAMQSNQAYISVNNRYDSIRSLSKLFASDNITSDYSLWYKNYIFGYVVGDNILPPWAVSHFRRYTTSSEFYPYGRPMFIGSLARYKSYKLTEMLVDLARPASFPTKVFKIKGHEDMTEGEIYQKVNEIRQMYQNITSSSKQKDELSVGEAIFTIDGVVDFEQFESRMNLSDLGDLDAKRKDLIFSTGIPEGYIDTTQGSWGQSGQALLQQSKVVARNIYPSQTTIIENIANDFKMHLLITGDLQGADTEFEIYMNYPVIEESSDRMRLKSDSIRLANDILTNLGTSLGLDRGEALPAEIVADVFGKYSFLDMEEVSSWITDYEKGKDLEENFNQFLELAESEEEKKILIKESKEFNNYRKSFLSSLSYDKPSKKLKEKVEERLSEEVVREVYFTSKRANNLCEGVSLRGKHYKLVENKIEKGSVLDLVKKEHANVSARRIREKEAKEKGSKYSQKNLF